MELMVQAPARAGAHAGDRGGQRGWAAEAAEVESRRVQAAARAETEIAPAGAVTEREV